MAVSSRSLASIFLCYLASCFAEGAVHHYDFIVKESNFTRLGSTKSILVVNDSFPGPEIHVHKGDTVFVNVYNKGTYGVTIHWHGVKEPRNPWSDGPEYITQCPIQPGNNFTQEINFSDEEGTLWWHAHSDWSRATVHGAIVVYPPKGKSYPYTRPDEEKTVVLASWYKKDVMVVYKNATDNNTDPDVSDAFTINGQPGVLYSSSNATTFSFTSGKTYLLRIINAVLNEEMFFSIAKHNLTVVGMDGTYMKPVTVRYVMITPGQTMDVLVKADQPSSYYYMAASPYAHTMAPFDNTTTSAFVVYKGHYSAPSSIPFPYLPATNDTSAANTFVAKLRSLASAGHPATVPKIINRRLIITVSSNNLPCPANETCLLQNGNKPGASLNNQSFVSPTIDILQAYYRNLSGYYTTNFGDVPPEYFNFTGNVSNIGDFAYEGTNVIMLNYKDSVELVFQGTNLGSAENHPMHLHGFTFFVVGKGSGNFNNATDPKSYNLVDPPELNTIGIPRNGWAAIRFVANNPGVWFMHCHLERHTTWGMATTVIVREGGTTSTNMRPPPPFMPPCSA